MHRISYSIREWREVVTAVVTFPNKRFPMLFPTFPYHFWPGFLTALLQVLYKDGDS
jgi:hypothetical protein